MKAIKKWWGKKIATILPLKHNKPDIFNWNKHDSTCFIIDIDVNITKSIILKHDNQIQSLSELKRLYPNFLFEIAPIVVGSTGLVTADLRKNIEKTRYCKHQRYFSKTSTNGFVGSTIDSKIGHENEK